MASEQIPKKPKKQVSFMEDCNGFTFTPGSYGNSISASPSPGDDKHWRSFGSLSKSEFSFISDRSSFAASLNTISDANLWMIDAEQEKEQKLDFNAEENKNLTGFTFGHNSNHIQTQRSISHINTSPKSHNKSSSSITFSSTLSLFSENEKKQNALLFYDLWGVPATTSRGTSQSTATDDGMDESVTVTATAPTALSKMSTMFSVLDTLNELDEIDPSSDDEQEETPQNIPTTKLEKKKKKSGGFRYRKRESTADFIFGKTDNNV